MRDWNEATSDFWNNASFFLPICLESEGEFDNRSEINNRALATIMVIAMRMTI